MKWKNGGMVYAPYPPYEILKTSDISYEEIILLKRVEEMVDKYYNSQKFKTILKYFITKFENVFDFYLSLGTFFYDKGYLSRSISSVDYYKVFLEFNAQHLHFDNTILKEIVKFDYLEFNKKRYMPDFLLRDSSKNFERYLKDSQRKGNIELPYTDYHLENFKIDIIKFLGEGKISEGEFYLIFDASEAENITDISYFINEEKH